MENVEIEMNCGNCFHYHGDKDKHGSQGVCVRNPPSVFPFPVQGIAGSEPRMMLKSFWPPVNESQKCGEFYPKQQVVPDGKNVRIGPEKLEN